MPTPLSIHDQRSMDTMQHIAGLLLRRLQGTLDATDAAVLEQWLATLSPENRKYYQEITDWQALETALQTFYRIDETAALQDVRARISTTIPGKKPAVIQVIRRYWVAAAAAVLFTGAGICWWIYQQPHHHLADVPMAVRYKSDALPGGNKAILQLGDGSIVELDSAGSSTLIRQQNVVVKNTAGALAYQPVTTNNGGTVAYNKITTPRGGQYQVVLPDGTHVWLNTASSLRYPTVFTGRERTVELEGEAYFEVAQQANQHFHVKVAGSRPMDITVLGTSFNVNAYTDEQAGITTLISGKVQVAADAQSSVLQPGQQASLYAGDHRITIQPADLEETLAWKQGLFYLQDADIKDIMRQVARWYDVEIVYSGTVTQRFAGKIPRDMKLSDVLKILESTGWVHFTVAGKTVTVMP